MHQLPVCSPPAVKVTAQAVAAPVVSVQGECTSKPSVRLNVPDSGNGVTRYLLGSRGLDGIFPAVDQPGFLDAVSDRALDHDVQHPHAEHESYDRDGHRKNHLTLGLNLQLLDKRLGHGLPPAKKSNLDSTGRRIVKKGCLVSHDAFRFHVVRVRLGVAYVRPVNAFGNVKHFQAVQSVACSDVQVIA